VEKIIQQNKDEITIKYISITLFSLWTFRKIKRVEKLRKELKDLQEQLEREIICKPTGSTFISCVRIR
jgi:hypothetical protein